MIVIDSPPLEPIPHSIFVKEKRVVETTRPENIAVKDPVDEIGTLVGAPGDEPDNYDAVRGARLVLGVLGGGRGYMRRWDGWPGKDPHRMWVWVAGVHVAENYVSDC